MRGSSKQPPPRSDVDVGQGRRELARDLAMLIRRQLRRRRAIEENIASSPTTPQGTSGTSSNDSPSQLDPTTLR